MDHLSSAGEPPEPVPSDDPLSDMMFETQEKWVILLDMLDGLIAQAVGRGWTYDQARGIVYTVWTSKPANPEKRS